MNRPHASPGFEPPSLATCKVATDHRQFDAFDRVTRLAAQARSLRRRDLSQIIGAFEQQNVFASGFSQRIGDAASDSTAADYHKLRSTRQT
jgi:hypothetical protein